MCAFRIEVVQCRGTPYELGLKQAEIFRTTRKGKAFSRRRTVRLPWWFDRRAAERAFTGFSLALWEEIEGLAVGLGVSVDRAAFAFGNGGLRPATGGCSAAISSKLYGRNYDYRPRHYGARLALVAPKGSYASVGFSECLTGRLDGMNNKGLAIGLHLVRRGPKLPGFSCVVIIRLVLDQCATTQEAVALLRRLPHAMFYNYSLLDAAGHAATVEAGPGAFALRAGAPLACTNHFQAPIMQAYNRGIHPSSWRRLPPLEAFADAGIGAEAMFRALNASSSPAFHHGYQRGAGTLHTLVCEPAKGRALLGVGGDAAALETEMLDIDLIGWAAGRDIAPTSLQGQLGGMTKPFDWPAKRKRRWSTA
jgi:predicted choloylglycine hydrolase